MLLDLSSAFDTIDHSILLSPLHHTFRLDGSVLSWFKSYLSGRSFKVAVNDALSDPFYQEWGFPQNSCLGILLFVLHAIKIFEITSSYLPNVHVYADDTQLYLSFSPNDIDDQMVTSFCY